MKYFTPLRPVVSAKLAASRCKGRRGEVCRSAETQRWTLNDAFAGVRTVPEPSRLSVWRWLLSPAPRHAELADPRVVFPPPLLSPLTAAPAEAPGALRDFSIRIARRLWRWLGPA